MLIDTHLHLSNEDYDIEKVIKNAKSNDVEILITGGTNKESNLKDIELSKKYNNIYITLGYHPEYANDIKEKDLILLEQQIISNINKVVGIGEIGLDYHYEKNNVNQQIILFKRQIEIAKKYDLPIVVHSRDAVEDTYNVIKESNVKGVIHCFSGSLEIAQKYIKLGFKLGIGGVVTFKNSKLKDVIKHISLNDIVLETDSPFLSPDRGEKNEPQNIKTIALYISELLKTDLTEVEKVTTNNSKDLFKKLQKM